MRLGVVSDTHGNLDFLQRAADILIRRFGVEAIVHLGDDMADALQMELRGRPLFAVPWMYEEAWRDERIPHRIVTSFGGVSFLLIHTPSADRHEAVLVLECADAAEARSALAGLPLVAAGLIEFELIPLVPYDGFARLFAAAD